MQPHEHLNPQLKIYNTKSATLQINERSIALQKQGKKIYRFGLGQSPFPVPPSVVNQLIKYASEKDYLPTIGLAQLRQSVSGWLKRDGLDFDADSILVGPGSKQLLFLAGLVLDSQLVVNTPCWVSYIPQAIFLGKKIIKIHNKYENRWRLTPEDLQDTLSKNDKGKKKVLIMTYPDNPTGLTYSTEELKKLAEIARKYDIIIISDEIYGKVHFDGSHDSIARYYPQNTIVSSGLSKWAGAGGWRLGLFCFPQNLTWMKNAMVNIASETYSAVSAPIQFAATLAFEETPEILQYLEFERYILKPLGQWVYKHIIENCKAKTHEPQGGFYIMIDLEEYREKLLAKNIKVSLELSEEILSDTGVAILPGSAFGRDPTEFTLRISYVNFDGEAALNALHEARKEGKKVGEVDLEFLQKFCPDTLEGIVKMVEWIHKI